ncbi:MAG: nucleoside triphosphate pyrophosphohydrolase [Desulfobacterales bacterium]
MKIDAIIELIETLRGEKGCPWDKVQTPQTILAYLLEETYELMDAVESADPAEICGELGDVLFHLLFLVSLFREMGYFNIKDVVDLNVKKMIRRHPHVFGDDTIDSADEVKKRWYKIKMEEKNAAPGDSILDSIPASLPALMRAYRMSERAGRTGFDWEEISGVMEKVEEEWSELKTVLKKQKQSSIDQSQLALEFGDVLFTLVNVARFANIHPETALRDATNKFERRFRYMEKFIANGQRDIRSVSQKEKDALWEQAKNTID